MSGVAGSFDGDDGAEGDVSCFGDDRIGDALAGVEGFGETLAVIPGDDEEGAVDLVDDADLGGFAGISA